MTYLPDTNILIHALAGKDPYQTSVRAWINKNQLVLSSIVIAEFLSNATPDESRSFQKLLTICRTLPVDAAVAQHAAGYRKQFVEKKKKVWLLDCLIAATCKVYDVTLVTADKRDYPMQDMLIITS